MLSNLNHVEIHQNAYKYYTNGGVIDNKRFIKQSFNDKDELVRVYCNGNFLGTGKLSKKDNTIQLKSDKLFIV